MRFDFLRAGPLPFAGVLGLVRVREKADEIVDAVVERIIINMMDFMAIRNGAMMTFPNLSMKSFNSTFDVTAARRVISLVVGMLGKRVSAEGNAVENNGVDLVFWQASGHK